MENCPRSPRLARKLDMSDKKCVNLVRIVNLTLNSKT